MRNKQIFWGIILSGLGVLLLLKKMHLLHFHWFSLFKLWPLLLIILGITLLPVKNSIKIVASLTLLVLAVISILSNLILWPKLYSYNRDGHAKKYSYEYFHPRNKEQQHFYEPYTTGIEEVSLSIDAIAGEFVIAGESEHLFEFNKEGNIGSYIFYSRQHQAHHTIKLNLEGRHFGITNLANQVAIKLNPAPIWNFDIKSGAAKIDLDLQKFKIREITLEGGASAVNISLGNKMENTSLKIESGASAITIRIPETSACELKTKAVLSAKNISGFKKIEKGCYQTENFADAGNKIQINIESAVSSLNIHRY